MSAEQDRPHPIGGVDYPRTLQEFDKWFSSEEACADYLRRLRWPQGFRCPACGGRKAWATGRDLLRCGTCQRQTSAVAGTVLEGTRKPLRTWFQAMWYVTNQKSGVSALGLQRVLGFGSYETAWTWLHKMRRAMARPGRDRLRGAVEVDETYVGGVERREDPAGFPETGESDTGVFVFQKDPVFRILREEPPALRGRTTGEIGFLPVVGLLADRGGRVAALPIATALAGPSPSTRPMTWTATGGCGRAKASPVRLGLPGPKTCGGRHVQCRPVQAAAGGRSPSRRLSSGGTTATSRQRL